MRKQELVHVHGLARLLFKKFKEDGILDPDTQTQHKQVAIRPTSLHARKDQHKEAAHNLLSDVATAIDETTVEENTDTGTSQSEIAVES